MSNSSPWSGREVLLRAVDVHKSYFRGSPVPVLCGVDLELRRGEFVSIIGASGSGKSTLLHLLGTLDKPDRGQVHWLNRRIDDQPAAVKDRFRNEAVGFIFQFYHLLPELDTLENVMLPALIRQSVVGYWREKRRIRARALEVLGWVGLSHRTSHRPSELSGGEMQRAAIARALLAGPQLLLADEPTGNLDVDTGSAVFELLLDLNRRVGLSILMVTHDQQLADRGDRVLRLAHGRLEERTPVLPTRAIG